MAGTEIPPPSIASWIHCYIRRSLRAQIFFCPAPPPSSPDYRVVCLVEYINFHSLDEPRASYHLGKQLLWGVVHSSWEITKRLESYSNGQRTARRKTEEGPWKGGEAPHGGPYFLPSHPAPTLLLLSTRLAPSLMPTPIPEKHEETAGVQGTA